MKKLREFRIWLKKEVKADIDDPFPLWRVTDKTTPPWYAKGFIGILESKLLLFIGTLVILLVFINVLIPVKTVLLLGLLLTIPCLISGVYMGICAFYCLKTGYYKYL
jgi:hypothetical protein